MHIVAWPNVHGLSVCQSPLLGLKNEKKRKKGKRLAAILSMHIEGSGLLLYCLAPPIACDI